MATPFALTGEELIEMWNGLLDQLQIESDVGEGAPTEAKAMLKLPVQGSTEHLNLLFAFTYKALKTYDSRMEEFLRSRSLV